MRSLTIFWALVTMVANAQTSWRWTAPYPGEQPQVTDAITIEGQTFLLVM